ncbi:bifunctional diguanylate cyclase/phosphohydrolase [Phascolarctobacterium sp.]
MEKQKDKILIVDDVELNRAILCELFAGDYEILEADNGKTAVELMQQYHEEIAIVLMDIVMPIMNGLEALEIMNAKGLTEKTPIFLITAESSNDAISKGFRLGVVDVVLKPFNPDNICQRVNNIIELYRYRYKLENLVQEQMNKIEKQNEQLRNFNVAMIDTLSTIVEFRDCESGQHVQRIRQLTKIMLKELGRQNAEYKMSDKTIEDISMAAALHDIGKIAIPDYILNKPGRLTAEEFAIMKEHTLYGCEILESIDSLKQNKEQYRYHYNICRWHHEKWDGSGYPDGLIGKEIPIYAQIVALADCYDALTSVRCYKGAFTHEESVKMIEKGECGAFSPDLLQCFLKIAPSLPEILQSDDGLPAVVYHYQHPNTEKFSGKKCYSCDMDKNSRVARLLEIEREKQKALFAMSGDIFFDVDLEKNTIAFSDEYHKVFDRDCFVDDAAEYNKNYDHVLPEDKVRLDEAFSRLTEENPRYEEDVRAIDKFGDLRWYKIYVNAIWDKEEPDVIKSVVGRMVNIDKMKREIGQWKGKAESDVLTKLGNRAYGERLLQQLLCEPQQEKAAVMFLDVDNFKMVNDRHGHLFGDEVLCRIANEISRQFRTDDIVCRIGGDEFLIIMRNIRDLHLPVVKVDDLRAGIERLGREADIQVPLSVSVGVSFYPVDGTDEKTLLHKADKALYEAKKRGKNNCVIYSKELEAEPFMSQITVAESE